MTSNAEDTTPPASTGAPSKPAATPYRSEATLVSFFGSVFALAAIPPAIHAHTASAHADCPTLWHTIISAFLALISLAFFAFAFVVSARPSLARRLGVAACAIVVTGAGIIGFTALNRARNGTYMFDAMHPMRYYALTRRNAIEQGDASAGSVLAMFHAHPELLPLVFDPGCPTLPPMPDREEYGYAGITAADAAARRATIEQIHAAAEQTLGDQHWERIGWMWFRRDLGNEPPTGSTPYHLMGAFTIFNGLSRHPDDPPILIIAYAHGETRYCGSYFDTVDLEHLWRCIEDTERITKAPIPQPLRDLADRHAHRLLESP